MAEAQTIPYIGLDACAKMVEAASACPATPAAAAPVTAGQPNWDAMASSFASLSLAFTVGSIALGVVAVISAIGWGFIVKARAEKEAREEARKCAREVVDQWLATEAPMRIRMYVEYLQDTSIGTIDDDRAADDIGKGAG